MLAYMKVINSNVSNEQRLDVNRAQQADPAGQTNRAGSGRPAGGGGSDRVQMSSIANILGGESAGRAERAERLKSEVQAGRYQVDSQVVGKAIVDSALSGNG